MTDFRAEKRGKTEEEQEQLLAELPLDQQEKWARLQVNI